MARGTLLLVGLIGLIGFLPGLIVGTALEMHFGSANPGYIPVCRPGAPDYFELVYEAEDPQEAVDKFRDLNWTEVNVRYTDTWGGYGWLVKAHCAESEEAPVK